MIFQLLLHQLIFFFIFSYIKLYCSFHDKLLLCSAIFILFLLIISRSHLGPFYQKGKEMKKGKNARLKPAYTTNNQNAREAETTLKKKACSPAQISRRWRRKKPSPTPGTHSADSRAGQSRVKTQPGDRLLRVRWHPCEPARHTVCTCA